MKLLDHEKRKALQQLRWLKENLREVVVDEAHRINAGDPEEIISEETEYALEVAVGLLEGRLTL